MRINLIGKGYWGNNLARCLSRLHCLGEVIDPHVIEAAPNYETVDWDGVDGAVIATPPATHKDIALWVLENTEARVLIEKPMTTSLEEAQALEPHADRIMVDHTFLFVPEFQHIRQMLLSDALGDPLYAYSDRLNLGKFQSCGVVWDLAPHDLALFQWLFDEPPEVQHAEQHCIRYEEPDMARMSIKYGDVHTHLHMSWIHPTKVRKTTIIGTAAMVVYDMLAEEKIKVYYPSAEVSSRTPTESYGEYLMRYRGGAVVSPAVEQCEPLMAMCAEFRDFIQGGCIRSDYELGRDVVSVLQEVGD